MSPIFESWRSETERLPEEEAEFQRHFFVRIAGVLFAGKGGELLILNGHALTIEQQFHLIDKMSSSWGYEYAALCRNRQCARLVVYNPSAVREALGELPESVFHRLGYSHTIEPVQFLREVGRRWRNRQRIPHEIGLVLGYPVKDVLGFIGLEPLQRTATCGWRIYGDPDFSLRKSALYKQARQRAEEFVGTAHRTRKTHPT